MQSDRIKPQQHYDVATDVARKIAHARRILGSVQDEDLAECRASYSRLDTDMARLIARLCDAEIAWRQS